MVRNINAAMLTRNFWLIGVLFSFLLGFLVAQEDKKLREELIKLADEVSQHYQKNELDQAIQKMNRFLLERPQSQEALQFREKIGRDVMLKMLMQGGEISRVARAMLLYAEKAPIRKESDPEMIKKLVERAVSASHLYQRHEALGLLQAQVGEVAIPHLLPYLTVKGEQRINAILTATKLGNNVIVPLIEALGTSETLERQQIVIILGHIADERALPDLRRLTEDSTQPAEVEMYAQSAIKKIARKEAVAIPPAKELYYQRALSYYKASYKPSFTLSWLFWKWMEDQKRLESMEVPAFAYESIMAEHSCYKALEIDPTMTKVWALLARIYYSQYVSVVSVEEAAQKGMQIPPEDIEKFQKERGVVQKARNIVAACGVEILYESLKHSLREDKPEVTIKILEDIGELGKQRGDLPESVLLALKSRDKRIRYAAAEALVKIYPRNPFQDSYNVVQILKDALGEWDSRVILVIDPNDADRNFLIKLIRDMGMSAYGVSSALEGIEKAKSFPPEDMILLSTELQDMALPFVINSIREDYRSRDIPILLVSPEAKREGYAKEYEKIAQIKKILTRPFSSEAVKADIKTVIQASGSDYKSKAQEVAKRAVATLASIPADSPIFNLASAKDALGGVLSRSNDSIRMPAISALGKLGDKNSVPALQEILYDKESSLEVRIAVVNALGQIFNKAELKIDRDDANRMMDLLNEKPSQEAEEDEDQKRKFQQFKERIFYLLGQANILPDVRRKLFKNYRVHDIVIVKAKEEVPAIAKPKDPEKPKDDTAKPATPEEGEKTGEGEGDSKNDSKKAGDDEDGEKSDGENDDEYDE